jgi:hypothetical protein
MQYTTRLEGEKFPDTQLFPESGTFIFSSAVSTAEAVYHDMELSRLSSIVSIFAAANIFYAIYGIIQKDLINTLIPILTFLILIYSAAILDEKASESRRR